MHNTYVRGSYINHDEVPVRNHSDQQVALSYQPSNGRGIPKIFVVCDQDETAPLWGYILRQQGLNVILQSRPDNAIDCWSSEMPELIVIDVDKHNALELCKMFRTVSVVPILLFLPSYNETEILKAYAAGADDVLVKPVSHTIFVPKIMTWIRRSQVTPTNGLNLIRAGKYRLDPRQHCLLGPNDIPIKLTNLEFHLLHLLMTHPGSVFSAEEITDAVWRGYGNGDQVVLKNVVYRLRKKIEMDPGHPLLLQTKPGGYSFEG